jgi:FMN phosphatase YigB (HAD superfamily)
MKHFIFDLDDTLIVHRNDIHYRWVREDEWLTHHIRNLQSLGKLYVFTNGTEEHAQVILNQMNLTDYMSGIYSRDLFGKDHMKPSPISYQIVENLILGIHSQDSLETRAQKKQGHTFHFFDDRLENLQMAKERFGWTTTWIHLHWDTLLKHPYVDTAYPRIHSALSYVSKEYEKRRDKDMYGGSDLRISGGSH